MKNVTISVDDELAARARVEAAKQGKSLSRYVSEAVRIAMVETRPAAELREVSPDDRVALDKLRSEATMRGVAPRDLLSDLLGEPRPTRQMTAMERFLAGPTLDLLDENGKAPTRDQIYDRDLP